MLGRSKTTPSVEEQILTSSRRRCTLCFGLTRDTSLKRGQIAHVDRDPANNDPDNLVFLCLDHHAEYDSTSRQTKGLTPAELRVYRTSLYASIQSEWSKPAAFTPAVADPLAAVSGHYVLERPGSSAEFQISHLGNGVMQVSGLAVWSGASSAHTGTVDFVGDLRNDRLLFADRVGDNWYNLELKVRDGTIHAVESSNSGYHGMNVSFAGDCRRV